MSYSTPTDVRNALTPGGDPTDQTTAASLTDVQIQDSIDRADAKVDGFLAPHYALPFTQDGNPTTTPALVRYASADIAAYLVTLVWKKSDDIADTDPVARRYKEALATLTAIQMQNIVLTGVDLADATQSQEDVFVHNRYDGTLFYPGDFANRPANDMNGYDTGNFRGSGPYSSGTW